MSELCRRRDSCRLCGGDRLTQVLSLTPTPPANAFVGAEALDTPQACFPLDVFFCEDCAHVQLLDVVDPALLFENYVYVSGTSPVFVKHFEAYAGEVVQRFVAEPAGSLAIDIGSNDGTLLAAFKGLGLSVLGIDPARDIAADATARGIETRAAFFDSTLARRLAAERGPARVITANNVFAHADDLGDIVVGIRDLLAADGVFVFEVSYLVDVYENTLFDTIYHEHLAYHSVKPLLRFFAANGLRLFAAERVASHGGSLRGFVGHADGPWADDGSVAALVRHEETLGLDSAETLIAFAKKIDALRDELGDILAGIKAKGGAIAAFGAPAKATTLMYHFGFGPEIVDFIIDDSPLKQGLYSPGMHIPVLPSSALYERNPDATIILAWNFAEPIIANHAAYQQAGGQFVIPLPLVEIR